MKILLIAVAVIFASGQPIPEGQNHAIQHQAVSHKTPKKAPSPSSYQKSQNTTTYNQYSTNDHPNDAAEWWLVWVGVGGIIVGLITLGFIRKQAKSTQDAAEAAKLNAQAVINSERAIVLIDREELKDKIQPPRLLTIQEMATQNVPSQCVFFFKNFGKTTAKMIGCKIELQMGGDRGSPPNVGIYEKEDSLNFKVPQGLSQPWLATLDKIVVTEQERRDVKSGAIYLWLCGFFKYEDMFGCRHETRFCYLWETMMAGPDDWRQCGPAEYNRSD